jgi:hypothetical protein
MTDEELRELEESIRSRQDAIAAALRGEPPASGDARPGGRAWEPPVRLGEAPEVPAFPADVLPAPLARLVAEVTWAMNCPTDYAGVPLLALAGGAIANSRHLAITATHRQAPALFTAYVGRPGTTKSSPLKMLRRPFDLAQQRFLQEWRQQLNAWEGADPKGRGPRPAPRRCVVSDVTTESLGSILAENPRGLLMVRPELAALVAGMNQYKQGKGHDRQVYLALWDGDILAIDRKSDRGGPLYVTDPFTAIVGSIQPDVLGRLRGEPVRGVPPPDDGFLDRFLFAYPPELPAVGEQWREVSPEALDAWQGVVDRLLGLEMVAEDGHARPFLVRLSRCGRQEWQRFTQAHADEMNAEDFLPHLFGPWAKLKGYAARLALVVHYLRWAVGDVQVETVDGESMARATRLVHYFKGHLRKVYALMDADHEAAGARRLLRWIAREQRQEFKRWEAHKDLKNQGLFPRPEDLDGPLHRLVKHGFLRVRPAPAAVGPGRPAEPSYEVNPLWDRRVNRVNRENPPAERNLPDLPDSPDEHGDAREGP